MHQYGKKHIACTGCFIALTLLLCRSLLTGLFGPTSGSIDVYGRDMQANIDDIRRDLGVCMQYDVLFDDLTAKEHLLLYGQIKSPHWSKAELNEQVRRSVKSHLNHMKKDCI